jgi:hypothetical protein
MANECEFSRSEQLAQWEAAFGLAPPPYLSIPFMTKALAYQAQCKRAGGTVRAKLVETGRASN